MKADLVNEVIGMTLPPSLCESPKVLQLSTIDYCPVFGPRPQCYNGILPDSSVCFKNMTVTTIIIITIIV